MVSLKLKKDGVTVKESVLSAPMANLSWNLGDDFALDFGSVYSAEVSFEDHGSIEKNVSVASLYDSKAFNDAYEYKGNDLGANYSKERTVFKV